VAIAACLAAASIAPCLFDPRAERVFDEPKVLIVRSVAALAAAALLVWAIDCRHRPSVIVSRLRDARALLIATAIVTAAHVTASLSSSAPRVAWDGAYVRRHGTYTVLSCVACFLAVLFVVRTRDQIRRLTLTLRTNRKRSSRGRTRRPHRSRPSQERG